MITISDYLFRPLQFNLQMSSFIYRLCDRCCPWFALQPKPQYYESKTAENQREQFMREVAETIPDGDQQHKRIQIPQKNLNNFETMQPMPHKQQQKLQDLLQSELALNNYDQYLSKEHPYYDILSQKWVQLKGIFNFDVEPESKVPETPYNLKIYIKPSEDEKRNIFIYTFTFPTTFEFYEELQNNFQLQKAFDTNIEHYDCKQNVDENTKIIYLAYKKMLIVQPRDFIYVRYSFKESDQIFWSVATSIPEQETYQGIVRGTILLTATRIVQKQNEVEISVYSEVDMKLGIKAGAAKNRGITEIKKYLDRCYDYVQKQKNSIL